MKEKLSQSIGRIKQLQAELSRNRRKVEANSPHPSFEGLLELLESPDTDKDILLQCIFTIFEEHLELHETLEQIISPSQIICEQIAAIQGGFRKDLS